MKDQQLLSNMSKGFIAALIAACFTINVQAAPLQQEPQHKMSKMSDDKMNSKKKDKMSKDKMNTKKMDKMQHGKMSKDTSGKM